MADIIKSARISRAWDAMVQSLCGPHQDGGDPCSEEARESSHVAVALSALPYGQDKGGILSLWSGALEGLFVRVPRVNPPGSDYRPRMVVRRGDGFAIEPMDGLVTFEQPVPGSTTFERRAHSSTSA